MVKKIFVDIETLPPDEVVREEITPDIIAKLESKKVTPDCYERKCTDEEFKRLALHGEYGRVLSIGVIVETDGVETIRGVLGRERQTMMFHLDEARTLRAFWKLMQGFNTRHDLIIGHNAMNFDLPFLYKRSMVHRVEPTVKLSFARYRSQPIFDTMHEFVCWDRKFISLAHLAKVLKVDEAKTEGMSGGLVYERFCAGCHDEIAEYCLQDVELTRAVYRCMCPNTNVTEDNYGDCSC